MPEKVIVTANNQVRIIPTGPQGPPGIKGEKGDQGNPGTPGAVVGASEKLLRLNTLYSSYNQANRVVVAGTFVATATAHWVTIDISGQVLGGGGHRFDMMVGVPPEGDPVIYANGGRLNTSPVGFAAPPGVTEWRHIVVGSINAEQYVASLSRRALLKNLTVGRTYRVELSGSSLGGRKDVFLGNGTLPFHPQVTLDNTHVLVPCFGSSRLDVVAIGNRPGVSQFGPATGWGKDFAVVRSIGTNGNPFRVAPIPNSDLCAVTNSTAKTVQIINWKTGVVVRTTAEMPSGDSPWGVACSATIAYVSGTNSRIYPVTIATGLIGAPITVGASETIYQIAISPNQTKLWVPNATDNYIRRFALPSLTQDFVHEMVAPPSLVRARADGSVWASCQTTGRIYRIDPSITPGSPVTHSIQTFHHTGVVTGISSFDLASDNRLIYAISGKRMQYFSTFVPQGAVFDTINLGLYPPSNVWSDGAGMTLTNDEYVILSHPADGVLQMWPSNIFLANAAEPDTGEADLVEIHIEGAVT